MYLGLSAFNARARATNFADDELADAIRFCHGRGTRVYVALNTLVFDHELPAVAKAIAQAARAGADALIVQDPAVAKIARAVAPTLAIHASTQMTCTDASSVRFAESLGAVRVVLARELSLADIRAISEATEAELEVFVHGALCVAYSGQCLTSEAIGGRSANRGACAQACRLPYDLVVDGEARPLGDMAFLLSPEDLEASALVPELHEAGVTSLKIEGRLKGPEYVASTTRLYRKAVLAVAGEGEGPTENDRNVALQTFTRGSGSGFLRGVDHQRLVDGKTCDHRGLFLGSVAAPSQVARGERRTLVSVKLAEDLRRGDGVLFEGKKGGDGEVGGRVWAIVVGGTDVESASRGDEAQVWLGPDKTFARPAVGGRVWKTSDPARAAEARAAYERSPARIPMSVHVAGKNGELPTFTASARGKSVSVRGDVELGPAEKPLRPEVVREKLEKLSDTAFSLADLTLDMPERTLLAISSVNRARRALTAELERALTCATHEVHDVDLASLVAEGSLPKPVPAGLFVLARTLEQARAALVAGADGVYLDFLDLQGVGVALRTLRSEGHAFVGVAPPRIRKPGEEKIDKYLAQLSPDGTLVRGLGAVHDGFVGDGLFVGDFSLNVTNAIAARTFLARGLSAFTPSFDLDSSQMVALVAGELASRTEVVLHHPMPLFHTEHCVFAHLLSEGRDHRTCGRPCDRHAVALRDRAGMSHPVIADVGCRNTIFHEKSQSAADLVPTLLRAGAKRFRIELVRETPEDVTRLVTAYRALLAGTETPQGLVWHLKTDSGYGVVRGSLRVLRD